MWRKTPWNPFSRQTVGQISNERVCQNQERQICDAVVGTLSLTSLLSRGEKGKGGRDLGGRAEDPSVLFHQGKLGV